MKLQYLMVNQAWVFTLSDSLIRMGDGPMFHETRDNAVYEARICGLTVDNRGNVKV